MTFAASIAYALRHTFDFKGSARRSDYWYFALFIFLVQIVLGTVDSLISRGVGANFQWLENIAAIALSVPQLAVSARRYHDAGFSAKWLLAYLVPAAAFIYAIPSFQKLATFGDAPTDAQLLSLVDGVAPFFISITVMGAFNLTITLLKSKPAIAGNRYVKADPDDPQLQDLKNQGW